VTAMTDAARQARIVEAPWWQKAVIYQIYPRSFKDSNGDGIGDLPGITSRLDYLHWLGVDAIWLSPIYPSPMADFGYDVTDHQDIDPIYGTLADFDALVARAHTLGLRVLLDFIPNHTSNLHPWFLESRSSRTDPKRNWYVWKDATPDGSPPNNWISIMGGSVWEWDEATGQYYLHSFLKEQPDLNWRSPDVRAAMHDVLRFWLARGVDGFRIDAIYNIAKDPTFADTPTNPMPDPTKGEYDTMLHLGHDKGFPDIHPLMRELRQVIEQAGGGREPLTMGEAHLWDWGEWASYYGAALDEMHFPFNFAFTRGPYTAASARAIVSSLEAAIPTGAWPNYVLGNHDEPRIATRMGAARAPLAMLMLLTLRGTPTVYYGDELAMQDVPIPPEETHDPVARRVPGQGRDPERTPMQWNDTPNAEFCAPGVRPWLPISADYQQINVACEREELHSILTLTQRALALRRCSPALSLGAYQLITGTPDEVFTYLRSGGGERYFIALNFAGSEQPLGLREVGGAAIGTHVLSTLLDRESPVEFASFVLRPYEGCLIRL
jgi:alpha-glucosidase